MDWNRYKNHLLAHIPMAKSVAGGKEILCRCMECQDSQNQYSAHFYISIPYGNNEPSQYNCMLCHCGGYVTTKQLIAWDVYDKDIALDLEAYNKSLMLNSKFNGYINKQKIHMISNRYTTYDKKSEIKRKYICNRVGIDLSYKDLKDLKICLNLLDLAKENRIEKFTRDHNIISDLDREFVGFISVDNSFINMRRTCEPGIVYKTIDDRYINYQIFDKTDTSQRFFTIPAMVDISQPFTKVHIAEGPFDILSIYLNVRNKEPGIYTCVAGSNYINNILYYLMDVPIPNIELHLYPDNDKYGTMEKMLKIIARIPDKTIHCFIHRNIYPNEKDFGVPKYKIEETILPIK